MLTEPYEDLYSNFSWYFLTEIDIISVFLPGRRKLGEEV